MKTVAKHMLYYVLLAFVGVCIYAALSGHAQAAETAVTASQTLTASLVDIIQQVSSGVKQGVSFLQQEIPDVVKQLLMWKFAEALVWTCAAMLLALQFPVTLYYCVKYHNESHESYDFPGHVFLGLFSAFVAAVAVARAFVNGTEALKIYIAPKVWLIEYAASLVK